MTAGQQPGSRHFAYLYSLKHSQNIESDFWPATIRHTRTYPLQCCNKSQGYITACNLLFNSRQILCTIAMPVETHLLSPLPTEVEKKQQLPHSTFNTINFPHGYGHIAPLAWSVKERRVATQSVHCFGQ